MTRLDSISVHGSIIRSGPVSALRSVFALVFVLGLIGGCRQAESTAPNTRPRANPDLSTHDRPTNVSSARSSDAQNPNTSTPSSGDAMPQGKTVASAPDTEARFCVSLVYSPGYSIKLGGLEKLHPFDIAKYENCLLYTSPSPRDKRQSRMPSSA